MHKRVVSIAALALLTLLTACGNSSSATPANNGSTQAAPTAAAPAAAPAGDAEAGKTLFASTCAACHGVDGKGLPNLGKDLVTSQFVASETDEQLVDFVKKGRAVDDPANTTGIAMPPKGGNPALTDDQIRDIVAYIRTIHQ